jgi:hypothetical protein
MFTVSLIDRADHDQADVAWCVEIQMTAVSSMR